MIILAGVAVAEFGRTYFGDAKEAQYMRAES